MTSILNDGEIKTNEISFDNLNFKANNINQKAQSATKKIFAHYFLFISQKILCISSWNYLMPNYTSRPSFKHLFDLPLKK